MSDEQLDATEKALRFFKAVLVQATMYPGGFYWTNDRALSSAERESYLSAIAQLREARKDSERLDWMDVHAFTLYRGQDHEFGGCEPHIVAVAEEAHRNFDSRRGLVFKTSRESIDAAISATSALSPQPEARER